MDILTTGPGHDFRRPRHVSGDSPVRVATERWSWRSRGICHGPGHLGRVRPATGIDASTTPTSTEGLSIESGQVARVLASGAFPNDPQSNHRANHRGVTGGTWTMADRRRSGARATGARSRAAASSPAAGAGSAAGSGSSTSTAPKPTPTGPRRPSANHDPATRATYRLLLLRGLGPDEAANLTAYLCGLPVGEAHWSLGEINRLLFLRDLARSGRWSLDDGLSHRPN